jgi:rhodanese-related sulfurtransferase
MPRRRQKSAGKTKPVRTVRDLIEEAKRKTRHIPCEEAAHLMEDAEKAPVLIDVREEFEYETVRLGGSSHIARGVLEMMVEHEYPDRNTSMLIYCGRGDRSALAALTLKKLGYRHVASIEGGLHAWREKGLPVVIPVLQQGPGSGI